MAFGRRNRPSLIQTAARTAVITGTASAVTGRAARKQAAFAASQPVAAPVAAAPVAAAPVAAPVAAPLAAPVAAAPVAAAPVAAVASPDELIARLERLAALHTAGALTDDEFALLKSQAIG
ncbi:hypothetical protein GCM10022381_00320 [Leifsonia kafniensis]|uniref:SHOCT domain-containing protein n=1 Tax=Leifsonia kafniensis TaxID=475957 RepID=A0ABP7JYD3_9MICO